MKYYRSTEHVDAMEVKYLQGNAVSEKAKPKDKDLVILPDSFINTVVIRIGDMITFNAAGRPLVAMSKAVFETEYAEVKRPKS